MIEKLKIKKTHTIHKLYVSKTILFLMTYSNSKPLSKPVSELPPTQILKAPDSTK